MIRRLLLSSVALAAVSTASFAADLPARNVAPAAPYVAAPIFTWTGFYVGAQIGGGWTNDGMRDYLTAGNIYVGRGNLNGSGVIGGLFTGYNWQAGNNFLVGVEGDIEATSISPRSSVELSPGGAILAGTYTYGYSLPWQGSLRLRLGYTMGQTLFYATGGLALAQINTKYTVTPGTNYSFGGVQAGWTVGGGIEYAFNNNWTARAEYRYTQFSRFTDTTNAGAGFWDAQSLRHQINEHQVRVGIAYKFGAPASAVVAKY